MKEGYVQRAWEENRGWESGSKQGKRICHWRASYKKTHQPILPTTNHPIFSSCVVPLYPSYLLRTHSSLSLSLSLQGFATWLYRNIWLISLKKNTKATVKVSVRCIFILSLSPQLLLRCIFIHSRTQLYGGPLRIQESLSRRGPYSCNLQGLWLFVISLIVFVWSSKKLKNNFFWLYEKCLVRGIAHFTATVLSYKTSIYI